MKSNNPYTTAYSALISTDSLTWHKNKARDLGQSLLSALWTGLKITGRMVLQRVKTQMGSDIRSDITVDIGAVAAPKAITPAPMEMNALGDDQTASETIAVPNETNVAPTDTVSRSELQQFNVDTLRKMARARGLKFEGPISKLKKATLLDALSNGTTTPD